MTDSPLLMEFSHQCCDADDYLHLGYRCAELGQCVDALRPSGTVLWFSLPFRLGWSIDGFFYLQTILLATVVLSALPLFLTKRSPLLIPGILYALFIAALWMILQPTYFYTLSDTPATLIFLQAVILSMYARDKYAMPLYMASGLLAGVAMIMRLAYVVPLGAGIILATIIIPVIRKYRSLDRPWAPLGLLAFILPLLLQCLLVYKTHGQFGIIAPKQLARLQQEHIDSSIAGYDTWLTRQATVWETSCTATTGIITALDNLDWDSVTCLLGNRMYFYLGSYAPRTYAGDPRARNYLGAGAEQVGQSGHGSWFTWQLVAQANGTPSPDGNPNATFLKAAPQPGNNSGQYFFQSSSMPLPAGDYIYSLWLWTDREKESSVEVQQNLMHMVTTDTNWNLKTIQQQTVDLHREPAQHFFSFQLPEDGYVVTRVGAPDEKSSHALPTVFHGFYAWGARLSSAGEMAGYEANLSGSTENGRMGAPSNSTPFHRVFSPALLAVNLAVMAAALLMAIFAIRRNDTGLLLAALWLMLIFLSVLVILPEQRFVQPVLSLAWLLVLSQIPHAFRMPRLRSGIKTEAGPHNAPNNKLD